MNNLTKRETEVLKLVLDEKSTEDIANILKLSKRTVDTHRRNILSKTSSKNLVGLFKYAIKNNLLKL